MKVSDPQGQTWRVTRRWVPWRPRRRNLSPDLLLEGEDPIGFLFFLVLGLVLLPLLSLVVFLAVELVLLAVLLPVVVVLRIAFGHQWWIEARQGFRPHWEVQAGTWRESGEQIRQVAASIGRGDPPLRNLGKDETGAGAGED